MRLRIDSPVMPGSVPRMPRRTGTSPRALEPEDLGTPTGVVAPEPADRPEPGGVDPAVGAEDGVVDVVGHDLADHEVRREPTRADRKDLHEPAPERGRGSAGLGGRTRSEGRVVSPVSATSDSSGPTSFDDGLTSAASPSTAALTTDSPVASTFRRVSFTSNRRGGPPGRRRPPAGSRRRRWGSGTGRGCPARRVDGRQPGDRPGRRGPGVLPGRAARDFDRRVREVSASSWTAPSPRYRMESVGDPDGVVELDRR